MQRSWRQRKRAGIGTLGYGKPEVYSPLTSSLPAMLASLVYVFHPPPKDKYHPLSFVTSHATTSNAFMQTKLHTLVYKLQMDQVV